MRFILIHLYTFIGPLCGTVLTIASPANRGSDRGATGSSGPRGLKTRDGGGREKVYLMLQQLCEYIDLKRVQVFEISCPRLEKKDLKS